MKSLRNLALLFSLALLIATAALGFARHNSTPSPRIVFSVYANGLSQHVYWMFLDGNHPPQRMTNTPIEGSVVGFTPDQHSLFFSKFDVDGDILFRLNLATHNIQRISTGFELEQSVLTWTPDNEWVIVEQSDIIFLLHKDGDDLIPVFETFVRANFRALSPDGQWLIYSAYIEDKAARRGLYCADLEEPNSQLISAPIDGIETDNSGFDDQFVGWLDDEWILVERIVPEVGTYIVRMKLDGSGGERLVPSPDYHVWWLSDDRRTLILGQLQNNYAVEAIVRFDIATRQLNYIADIAFLANSLVISPDGHHIAFIGFANYAHELFKLDLADGQLYQLTDSAESETAPVWSPDNEWIIFSRYTQDPPSSSDVLNLYKIRPDGSDLQRLTSFSDQYEVFNLWLPPIDLKWRPALLLSLLAISLPYVAGRKRMSL